MGAELNSHATEWTATGAIKWSVTDADNILAINKSGEALASSDIGGDALLSAATGTLTQLTAPVIGGTTEPYSAVAMNNSGETVGSCSNTALTVSVAVKWSAKGAPTVLASPQRCRRRCRLRRGQQHARGGCLERRREGDEPPLSPPRAEPP